jgi:hypothetical protein
LIPLKSLNNVNEASRFVSSNRAKRDASSTLANGVVRTTDSVIVSETLRGQRQKTTEPFLGFLPDAKTVEPKDAWWDIRPEWVLRAIGVLGFEDVKINYHTQSYEGRAIELYTVVGKRTHRKIGGF